MKALKKPADTVELELPPLTRSTYTYFNGNYAKHFNFVARAHVMHCAYYLCEDFFLVAISFTYDRFFVRREKSDLNPVATLGQHSGVPYIFLRRISILDSLKCLH